MYGYQGAPPIEVARGLQNRRDAPGHSLRRAPEAIARWFAEIPLIDDRTAQMIAPEYIIELEVLSRAVDFRGASLQNPYAARP